tara:strand:- start:1517 stop:1939 length:423 start_codon:yes stop_codon:yes gene_type:complete
LNRKITDKDKQDWENFINSKDKVHDKDREYKKKKAFPNEKIIDLHGYTLQKANIEIEKFIFKCFEDGIAKINIITGKGNRSKNLEDPFQSKDLSILKYSVPNFIKKNDSLMSKILKIDDEAIESKSQGSFDIFLKKNDKK